MVTGTPEEQAMVRRIFKMKGWSHELAKDAYDELNEEAAKRLREQVASGMGTQ
jgi:hypothetical protein